MLILPGERSVGNPLRRLFNGISRIGVQVGIRHADTVLPEDPRIFVRFQNGPQPAGVSDISTDPFDPLVNPVEKELRRSPADAALSRC